MLPSFSFVVLRPTHGTVKYNKTIKRSQHHNYIYYCIVSAKEVNKSEMNKLTIPFISNLFRYIFDNMYLAWGIDNKSFQYFWFFIQPAANRLMAYKFEMLQEMVHWEGIIVCKSIYWSWYLYLYLFVRHFRLSHLIRNFHLIIHSHIECVKEPKSAFFHACYH